MDPLARPPSSTSPLPDIRPMVPSTLPCPPLPPRFVMSAISNKPVELPRRQGISSLPFFLAPSLYSITLFLSPTFPVYLVLYLTPLNPLLLGAAKSMRLPSTPTPALPRSFVNDSALPILPGPPPTTFQRPQGTFSFFSLFLSLGSFSLLFKTQPMFEHLITLCS